MRKRILFMGIPMLLIVIVFVILHTLSPIITGYAAKNLASGIFVAGRTQESMEKEDLNFSFIKYTCNNVNRDKKTVTSRFLFWTSKAIYIKGFGCTLVRDYAEEEIRSRPYIQVPVPISDPDTINWPMGDKITDTIPQSLNKQKLDKFLDIVFRDSLPMKGTFAVAIAYKNQLIAERYRTDLSHKNLFLSWSMAKSFTNTLIGILVAQNQLNIYQPTHIEAWEKDSRCGILLRNLLQMNSGLEWNENYGSHSDVNQMLFKRGNMASFASNKLMVAKPDSLWYYSSGTTNIVCRLIRDAIGNDEGYYAFPRKELFNKLGMRSAIFEIDASGNFVGSSYLYASMRDYIRYGLLYLHKGKWGQEQILPENWVDFTVSPASSSKGGYGAFFWLNQANRYPDAPSDTYSCNGHDGQYIFIIPSKELVIVRTGFSQKKSFDPNVFLKGILESIE